MVKNIIALAICFVLGVGISTLNYIISKRVLMKNADKYHFVTIIRQVIQVSFLVAIYLIGAFLSLNPIYTLIGGALGNTLSMFFFTKKLLNINKSIGKEQKNG